MSKSVLTAATRIRTEVRSSRGDRRCRHLFDDTLLDLGGLGYCIASASLTLQFT